MLDIKFIRECPFIIKKDLEKRNDLDKLPLVDEVLRYDEEWRFLKQKIDDLRAKRNKVSEEINKLKKAGKDATAQMNEVKIIPKQIAEAEARHAELAEKIKNIQMRLPNILHESVPVGKDDSENQVIRKWREPRVPNFELTAHGELIENLDIADFKRAAKISGAGFVFLKGDLALLDMALQRYAVDMLIKKGYTLVSPPFMMNRASYEGVTDLSDFESVMYKIEGEDLYLIATSEHPMGGMYMNEVLDEKDLPIKFCGLSACFRREIGSRGVDTKGLFRMHQSNKIEQFIFCKPDDSWKLQEELIKNAEDLFKGLEIPYRIVNICTGDIGTIAAKKYDLEAWMPREKAYKEVVSCSNCTSYQAVRLNVRYQKGSERPYVHTLNSTAIATSRAMRAILENYQNEDGTITVPKILVPYMNGKKVIGKNESGYISYLENIKKSYPNAYNPWTQEDDDILKDLFLKNKTIEELSINFKRKSGAIKSRLKKLGLIPY